MIVPPKLYLKRTEIPIESLLDMAEHESTWVDSGINRNGKALIDKSARSTKVKVDIKSNEYSDVAYILEQMVNIWDSILDPKLYTAKEFNYLKYGEGDKFTKHKDVIPADNANEKIRIFSTSTIISKTDDLVGGEFIIYDNYNIGHEVNLEVGETIFFDSNRHHEVAPVISGVREVLVAWIYERTNEDLKLQKEIANLRLHEQQFRHPKDLGMV